MSGGKPLCGVVLPISAIEDCTETHWTEVLDILTQAIEAAGFEANVVSNADEVGVIHKRIIQNLYDNPVVVVDVSAKNPNVMFELGMRLAFDKPTIVVKDDQTLYSFDTSAIEHIEYPRDLRFTAIVEFKDKLAEKIQATHKKSVEDKNYTTFLKHFGQFKVAKIEETEVTGQEFLLEEMQALRKSVSRLERTTMGVKRYGMPKAERDRSRGLGEPVDICLRRHGQEEANELLDLVQSHTRIVDVRLEERTPEHYHIVGTAWDEDAAREVEEIMPTMSASKRKQIRKKRQS